jgi:hypothetical protein
VGVSFEGRQEVIPQLHKGALQLGLSLAAHRMPAALHCTAHCILECNLILPPNKQHKYLL